MIGVNLSAPIREHTIFSMQTIYFPGLKRGQLYTQFSHTSMLQLKTGAVLNLLDFLNLASTNFYNSFLVVHKTG